MRFTIVAAFVVLLALYGGGVAAQEGNPPAAPKARAGSAPRPSHESNLAEQRLREEDQRIAAELEKMLSELRLEAAPLEKALGEFAEGMKVNVQVDWLDLVNAGLERDAPVTLALRNLLRSRVLRAMLDMAGGEIRLGFEARDGVLLIATQERLDRDLIPRVYAVRDLVMPTALKFQREQAAAPPGPAANLSIAEPAGATGREQVKPPPEPSRSTTQPCSTTAEIDPICLARAERELLEVLKSMVLPDAWRENGGLGAARIYDEAMVVYQTRRAHREVERFLADLRAAGVGAESGPDKAPSIK